MFWIIQCFRLAIYRRNSFVKQTLRALPTCAGKRQYAVLVRVMCCVSFLSLLSFPVSLISLFLLGALLEGGRDDDPGQEKVVPAGELQVGLVAQEEVTLVHDEEPGQGRAEPGAKVPAARWNTP